MFIHANNAYAQANAAFSAANSAATTGIGPAFDKANTANITADRAWNHANAAFSNANTILISAQSAFTLANISFAKANTANITADLAYGKANTANITADRAWNHANAAFDKANVSLSNTSGTTFNGNLIVSGTFLVTVANTTQLDLPGEIAEFTGNSNTYAQIHVRNANTQQGASVDIVTTADTGSDIVDYLDLGINNSGFSQPSWTINGARDGYLYTSNGNLAIGVANVSRSLTFFTSGTLAVNERMRIDASGNVGIGTTSPTSNLNVVGTANITSWLLTSGLNVNSMLVTASGLANNALPNTSGISFNGNLNFYSGIINVGSSIASVPVRLQTNAVSGSAITFRISGAASGNNTQMRFYGNGAQRDLFAIGTDISAGDGSVAFDIYDIGNSLNRLRIDAVGNVGIGTTTPTSKLHVIGTANISSDVTSLGNVLLTGATSGLGYGTGSGGIISQITSKVTGVTLNKLVGAVAANSAALTANTVATFTVTNNLVAATDTVLVNRLNGGTAGAYHFWCDTVSAGSFTISIQNVSTVSLSERIVIGYSVIKAVQA